MKSFIITLIIGAIITTGSIFYSHYLSKEAKKLSDMTREVKISIRNENYTAAQKQIDELNKSVSNFEKFFLATGDHIEIDNIRINLAELKSFASHEMKSDALSKIYVLEFLFRHLPHSTQLRIGNIL